MQSDHGRCILLIDCVVTDTIYSGAITKRVGSDTLCISNKRLDPLTTTNGDFVEQNSKQAKAWPR